VRKALAGALALGVFLFASLAFGAATFADDPGDDNAAPDVTSVSVSEAPDGMLTLVVRVGNYQSLPADSWFNFWFDLDSNPLTGDEGDEALVRYLADGGIDFYLWDGAALTERTSTGMTGQFAAGVLTLVAPESSFGRLSTFGILTVSARAQSFAETEFIATDFAPDRGRSTYTGAAPGSFPDPSADQDAAPDITSVRVSDAKDGWISIAVATPNYATLPGEAVLLFSLDLDNKASTGDNGAEGLITVIGGEIQLERWDSRAETWVGDELPTRLRVRNAGNVVTVDLHRSELVDEARFGFSVTAADLDLGSEEILGADFAPEDGTFWRYALTNRPALRLLATKAFGAPAQPRAGRPFTISLPVSRSDTKRGITNGTVTCNVAADRTKVRSTGRVRAGRGECSLIVPAGVGAIRGSLTVRSGGKSVTARFSFKVR